MKLYTNFCLASFTPHNSLKIHPCCCIAVLSRKLRVLPAKYPQFRGSSQLHLDPPVPWPGHALRDPGPCGTQHFGPCFSGIPSFLASSSVLKTVSCILCGFLFFFFFFSFGLFSGKRIILTPF